MKHEYFDPDPEHALRVLVRKLAHFDQHPEAHHHLPPGSVTAVEERIVKLRRLIRDMKAGRRACPTCAEIMAGIKRIHAKHRRRAEKLMRGQGKPRK